MIGAGHTDRFLDDGEVRAIVRAGLDSLAPDGKRLLFVIPDGTRTMPMPQMFALFGEFLADRATAVDYLIALGTHQPMDDAALSRHVGVPVTGGRAGASRIFNHAWEDPATFATIGVIPAHEIAQLSGGRMAQPVTVSLNRLIFDYDQIVICGPVFPHEVVGFSGGNKYFFPGIAGADVINFTHWLGALVTSMDTIGVKDTPVRRVIHRAARFLDQEVLCLAMVLKGHDLHGLYVGAHEAAWSTAADLSAQLNILYTPRPYRRVLSMAAPMYDDLWTAAKAMYKTEPAIADGGEVIIYAPHITEVSYTHGHLIDAVGYHVRDYFTQQWERFAHIPGGILAHSTHVKGKGHYDLATGVETPRIQVTLATGIPEERCRRINLGYLDYRTIDPESWANREDEGVLLVRRAGEMLYRVAEGDQG